MKQFSLSQPGQRRLNASLMLLFALTVNPALAQSNRYPAPHIDAFNVDEVMRIAPGTDLVFSIYGTPGGEATISIAGAARQMSLIEVEAGQYEGVYTISFRDKLTALSAVTANLRVGNQVTSTMLGESLQVNVGFHPSPTRPGLMPHIDQVSVRPVAELKTGYALAFFVKGTPNAKGYLRIDGVAGKIFLRETSEGDYAIEYVIRARDRITAQSTVVASLTMDDRVATRQLVMPLQDRNLSDASTKPRRCRNCGSVEAINLVEVKGEGGYLGTIGGGVVGALLGSQIGGGNGRTAAQIAGAVGGAYAGRAIEGNSRATSHFEVVVRLESGARQAVSYANKPDFRVGESVRVENGLIERLR